MTRIVQTLMAASLLALAGCRNQPAQNTANAVEDPNATANVAADVAALAGQGPGNDSAPALATGMPSSTGSAGKTTLPELVPPAPGEPGGLPDDREPLDESPIDPATVRGAGTIVELYAEAVRRGDYRTAWRMWRGGGVASGLTEPQFAAAWSKYRDLRFLVGRPETGGTETARVPLQVYGRLRANNQPFNMIGPVILARAHAAVGKPQWVIVDSNLRPRGQTREQTADAPPASPDTAMIPSAYRGRFAASAAECGKSASTSALQITTDRLIFYESSGRVSSVTPGPRGGLAVTARYSGEGENWIARRVLWLNRSGDRLRIDGLSRVRCPATTATDSSPASNASDDRTG